MHPSSAFNYTMRKSALAPRDSSYHYHRALYAVPEEDVCPRILLVDDDEVYTAIFADVASMGKIDIRVVNDYRDLGILDQEKFDLAILDYDLGGVNGQEMSSVVLSLFGPMPILLISATNRTFSENQTGGEICEFMHKAIGPKAILDAALEANDWWQLNNG